MSPGSTIAHYRILSKLGDGGMGEVWRATDTRLGRVVAIKILPAPLAGDPDRVARFTREAEVLASLNHPNIAAICGFEQGALVMELVKGPRLAGRIQKGRVPPKLIQQQQSQTSDPIRPVRPRYSRFSDAFVQKPFATYRPAIRTSNALIFTPVK